MYRIESGPTLLEPDPHKLRQAVEQYKRSLTPETVTKFWGAMLPEFSIPECKWTEGVIKSPMEGIKGCHIPGILVPVVAEINLSRLGIKYPEMACTAASGYSPIRDTYCTTGYVKVYASVDAPNRDTTQGELEEFAQKQRYLGERLIIYILASQAIKVLTGKYLDQGYTWSRLPGSFDSSDGSQYPIKASFYPDGHLVVEMIPSPKYHHPSLGARYVSSIMNCYAEVSDCFRV